jgi:hypothetical protein
MVGREHDHHVVVGSSDGQGGECHSGRRVPRRRLGDDVVRRQLGHLRADELRVLLVRHDVDVARLDGRREPGHRRLQQAAFPEQRKERLGVRLPAHRPQAGARAPAQDDRVHRRHSDGCRRRVTVR